MAISSKDKYSSVSEANVARYNRHVLEQVPLKEIARQEGVTPSTVRRSIDAVHEFRKMCTLTELDAAQTDMLLRLGPLEQAALREMLTATKVDEARKDRKGDALLVPDHKARARAIELLNSKMDGMRPKGKGTLVQVGVMAGGQGQQPAESAGIAGRHDFESILRRVKQRQAAAQLPAGSPNELASGEPDGEVVTLDAADTTA